MTYTRLEIRKGPHNSFLLAGIGQGRNETIMDAGLTGARAREEGRRLAQWLRVPLVDASVPQVHGGALGVGKGSWFRQGSR